MNIAIIEMNVGFFLFGGSLLLGVLTPRLKAVTLLGRCYWYKDSERIN